MSSPSPASRAAGMAMAELDDAECFELLRASDVGRLALVVDGQPEIFPVNFVVDRATFVFRTGAGTKLAGLSSQQRDVAFEVDGYDAELGEAWSVIAKGHAVEISGIGSVIEAAALPLMPWQVAPKPHFIRITPTKVTGRRFRVGWTTTRRNDQPAR